MPYSGTSKIVFKSREPSTVQSTCLCFNDLQPDLQLSREDPTHPSWTHDDCSHGQMLRWSITLWVDTKVSGIVPFTVIMWSASVFNPSQLCSVPLFFLLSYTFSNITLSSSLFPVSCPHTSPPVLSRRLFSTAPHPHGQIRSKSSCFWFFIIISVLHQHPSVNN